MGACGKVCYTYVWKPEGNFVGSTLPHIYLPWLLGIKLWSPDLQARVFI